MNGHKITLSDMHSKLSDIGDDPARGWVGNFSDDMMRELRQLGLAWLDGEYLRLTDRGEELLRHWDRNK